MKLPESFLDNMKQLLGESYQDWLASYDEVPRQGLRINNGKLTTAEWEGRLSRYACNSINHQAGDEVLTPIPWVPNGYYYPTGIRPARHPYYFAGLYYLQDPSAMIPAHLLAAQPGDRVLDLCAAPGGKSTELGACLRGVGMLVANDISNSRAQALLKNLELFGISNMLVTSEAPDKLADTFGAYFDKILVDAPCSGEGMFRKDPSLIKNWEEKGPEYYAKIQREILTQAVRMLAPGGYLLYSTCTFATVEDEDNVRWLLDQEPELSLCEIPLFDGAEAGCDELPVLRLFPHKIKGEGHFAALFQKQGPEQDLAGTKISAAEHDYLDNRSELRILEKETDLFTFLKQVTRSFDPQRFMVKNEQIYYLPEGFKRHWKLRYLRTGLLLGECKRGRFTPSQALAMALNQQEYMNTLSFAGDDERVIRYLKGETIAIHEEETVTDGWCLICVDDFTLGWAKISGRKLKNKYYPGWRWQ